MVRVSLQLFAEGGSEAISMRKLAAEVGVAPMSLYRYFPSKAHLMRHIWQDVLSRASHQGTLASAVANAPLGALHAFLDGFLQYWLDNPDHYTVVFAHPGGHGGVAAEGILAPPLRPDPQDVLETLGELLDECAEPRPLPPEWRHQMQAELFCGAIGFLLGTLGLFLAQAEHIERLRARVLDGLVHRVEFELAKLGAAATATPGRARVRRR